MYFKVKTQERRRFVGCLTVVIQIRKWRLIACVVMVMPWRLFAMQNNAFYPLRLKPYGYVQNYQTQLYICRYMISLCHGFFVVCVYICTFKNKLKWIIGSVNCDVTGPLGRHQKAVSCLGWDYKNPLQLDVVDRYRRRMGDKTIPEEALPSLELFYLTWVPGIDLPQSRCCGFFVSFTNKHK